MVGNRISRTALGGIAALVVLLPSLSYAARAIQGAAAEVSAADASALGPVGFRIWSASPGGETNFNDNTSSCRNIRCLRTYVANSNLNPGGYVGNQEGTQVYNGDLTDQPFYELADASMNDTAGNHIGFYGIAGVTGNNSGVGNFLVPNCSGINSQNCFGRIDTAQAAPPLNGTVTGYGGPAHTIRSIGGLNPIPNIILAAGGACSPGHACLTWSNPPLYQGTMRPSSTAGAPPSPVLGVRLWKNDRLGTCTDPSGDDPAWESLGTFDLNNNAYDDVLPQGPACRYYALSVRLIGPGGLPNEVETVSVGVNSQPININSTVVRLTRFDARYAGQGVVVVSWESALEDDLVGFYAARSLSASGPFERTSALVRTRGNGSSYSVSDRVPGAAGRAYFYQLQMLGRDGNITTSSTNQVTIPQRMRKGRPTIR